MRILSCDAVVVGCKLAWKVEFMEFVEQTWEIALALEAENNRTLGGTVLNTLAYQVAQQHQTKR